MLERDIERKFEAHARGVGALYRKFVSPGKKGVPDRLVIASNRRVLFLEWKSPTGIISPPQRREIRRLRERGHYVLITDSLDIAKMALEELTCIEPPSPSVFEKMSII